jgi:hypothetical protein
MKKIVVAYHEAGHAVVAWRLGRRPSGVSIGATKRSRGRVTLCIRPLESDSPRNWCRNEEAMVIALAGPLAQRRHAPRSDWRQRKHRTLRGPDRGTDFDLVNELLCRQHDGLTVRTAYDKYVRARTQELVDANWPAIERVAQALLERESLTRQELFEVIWLGVRELSVPASMARGR